MVSNELKKRRGQLPRTQPHIFHNPIVLDVLACYVVPPEGAGAGGAMRMGCTPAFANKTAASRAYGRLRMTDYSMYVVSSFSLRASIFLFRGVSGGERVDGGGGQGGGRQTRSEGAWPA